MTPGSMSNDRDLDFMVTHLERYFGEIRAGVQVDGLEVQIVKFNPASLEGVTVYSTLGLHRHVLNEPTSRKPIRHELHIIAASSQDHEHLPHILAELATEVIETSEPVLRGRTFGPRGVIPGTNGLVGFYASIPNYLEPDFAAIDGIAMVWLIPVMGREICLAQERGWRDLEAHWINSQPDLFDLERS